MILNFTSCFSSTKVKAVSYLPCEMLQKHFFFMVLVSLYFIPLSFCEGDGTLPIKRRLKHYANLKQVFPLKKTVLWQTVELQLGTVATLCGIYFEVVLY